MSYDERQTWIMQILITPAPPTISRIFDSKSDRTLPDNRHDIEEMATKIQRGYRTLNATMTFKEPQADLPMVNGVRKRLERDFCPTWRAEDDLPETARVFCQEAADLAAIPLKLLLQTCSQMERRLEVWSHKKEKEGEREDESVRGKGKGKAVA